MKIRNYLLNQSSLVKKQLNKNQKLVKELILPKTHISLNLSKDKSISVHDAIHPKKNVTEILKDENNLFIQLYAKTKKLYPTKVEETFKDLILQYKNNDYKIPDLSDKKNLFNQNPLLLVGRDLDQFYMYNEKIKKPDSKSKTKLVSRKHVNFIKKEMLYMEKILNKNNQINKKNNKNNLSNENNDKNNNININYNDDNEIDYRNEKINYFTVDSVWDKIKEQKLKQKNFKKYEKKRKEKLKLLELNKNIKNNKSEDKLNQNKNKKIESYNTFYKSKNSNCISLKNNKNTTYLNLNSFNSNSYNTIKNINSIDTIQTNLSLKSKISNNESPILKLKHNLLKGNSNEIFNKCEESNRLQKEIEEIKTTLSNSNLIKKNIIMETIVNIKPIKKNKNLFPNTTNYNPVINKSFRSMSLKKKFSLLQNNNVPRTNENNFIKKLASHGEISSKKNINDIKDNHDDSKGKKLNALNIFALIRKKTIPYLTLNRLLKENDSQKFLELISKVDLKIFSRKEIEKLMKYYCQKILGYSEKDTERIININKNDENIYRIIERTIKKTKKGPLRYYGKNNLKTNLEEVNNTIFDLKKKFIYGKTDYNYES